MAIPGAEPLDDITAKVRIGEKRNGKAASVDHFVCDHSIFERFAGKNPKRLRIKLVADDTGESFNTGLEWWVRTRKGQNLLACYTKDSGSDPVALRYEPYKDEDDTVRGEKRGQDRLPISCRFRQCPHFQSRDCRPMGRLSFYLADDPDRHLFRFETKGWSSIESIVKTLRRYDGDTAGRTFELSVAFEKKGNKRFPVVSITEVDVDINSEKDVTEADALVALAENRNREGLVAYLDATRPGWKSDERYVARIQEVGVDAAIATLLERLAS